MLRRVRGRRSARAATRAAQAIRRDPEAPALLLSPHLDDAALSCWTVLEAPGPLEVVTVFAGDPQAGASGAWDRLTRATDPVERMAVRRAEDRAALAEANRTPVHLALPEVEHRRRPVPVAHVLNELADTLPRGVSAVYAPVGIGGHTDHLVVRDAALALAARGADVRLYAELPYAARFGWPEWVSGSEPDPVLDPQALWEPALRALPWPVRPEVRTLDDDTAARKLAGLERYATQLPAVDGGHTRLMSHPLTVRHEVLWWRPRAGEAVP